VKRGEEKEESFNRIELNSSVFFEQRRDPRALRTGSDRARSHVYYVEIGAGFRSSGWSAT